MKHRHVPEKDYNLNRAVSNNLLTVGGDYVKVIDEVTQCALVVIWIEKQNKPRFFCAE